MLLWAIYIAVIVAIACAVVLSILADQHISKNWETLLAGVMALVAAIITVRKMQAQIDETKRQYDEKIQQQFLVARIQQSAALSTIQGYTQEVFAYYMACVFHITDSASLSTLPPYEGMLLPHSNDPLFEPLFLVATHTQYMSNTELIREMFENIQVSQNRLKEFHHPPEKIRPNSFELKHTSIAQELKLTIVPIYTAVQALSEYSIEDIKVSAPDEERIASDFLGLVREWQKQHGRHNFPDSFKEAATKHFVLDNVRAAFPNPFKTQQHA